MSFLKGYHHLFDWKKIPNPYFRNVVRDEVRDTVRDMVMDTVSGRQSHSKNSS